MLKLQTRASAVLAAAAVAMSAALAGCATTAPVLPEAITANPERHDLETVVILGTNDIHGTLAPIPYTTAADEPSAPPVKYERGGAATFAAHLKVLREEFGPRLLWLDGGDEFQGSIESNLDEGASMVAYYNALGLTAAAIGNHEFDFGPVGPEGTQGDVLGALKERMKEARYPYLAANIVDRRTNAPPDFPNTRPRVIVQAGRVKVGVIGLSTLDTPTTTRPQHVVDLKFTDLAEATRREAALLRKEGAQVVVVTAHVGLFCQAGRATTLHAFRSASDAQGECRDQDEMTRLLRALPIGTVDAVVSGHTHSVVHHWVAGVPVIQSGHRNSAYNLIYLTFDHTDGKLLVDRTRIEGPVPLCPKVFANQGDCNGDRPPPRQGRGKLVPFVLHGKKISPDSATEALLAPTLARSEEAKKKVVGHAARPIEHLRFTESPLGHLVADAIRDKLGSDAAMVNGGGIRAPFNEGPITYESLFRTLPFDNAVVELTVTGRELKNILRVAESGARGIFPVSGLKIKMIELDSEAPADDLNHNGKIDPWEVNRLLDVRLADGTPGGTKIRDEKMYRLATIDFLVSGGDDFGWAMNAIPRQRVGQPTAGMIRDVVQEYLAKKGPLNTAEAPLVDPSNPRVEQVKPKAGVKKRRRRRR